MISWLVDNWLAVVALLVAFVGGWPGVLQIADRLRPISLSGSIKFFAHTKSPDSPDAGILLAVTLLNEGSKALVWRKLSGKIRQDGKALALTPLLIPETLLLPNGECPQPDLLKQQSIVPGIPTNAYLLLANTAHQSTIGPEPSVLKLRFELESGRVVPLDLRFQNVHPLEPGESFPTHPIGGSAL
jgi:hypothetical protein